MNNEITITLPAIDETIIAQIAQETTETRETEIAALEALRERYSALAIQNDYIKTSYQYRGNSNWSEETETWYRRDGKKVKALLCVDHYQRTYTDQNRGRQVGSRLYLADISYQDTVSRRHIGEWIEITRDGNWSAWAGESEGWECGAADADIDSDGRTDILTDEEVIAKYPLADIVKGLSSALATMAEKLPAKLTKVRERASLASQLLAALK